MPFEPSAPLDSAAAPLPKPSFRPGEILTATCFLVLDGVAHPLGFWVDSTGTPRTLAMGAAPFEWAWFIADDAASRDVQFVICTHWLQKMSLQDLREQAPPWMRARIVGACEQFEEVDAQGSRRVRSAWSVIHAYATAHGIKHWVAVDHTDDGWPDDCTGARQPRREKTGGSISFTPDQAFDKFEKKLEKPVRTGSGPTTL